MGAGPSRTRKLTVENDDPTSVIKVSDDVVQRIRNSQSEPRAAPELSRGPQAPIVSPVVQPAYLYEPSLTTVQLRQANLTELKKNDEYWQNRLKNLQAQHKKINEIMDSECNKAIEDLQGKRGLDSPAKFLPPCTECKEAVKECYKQYSKEPMRCAKLVKEFQECVDLRRATLIANRG